MNYTITVTKEPQATPPHSGTVSCSSYSGTVPEGQTAVVTLDAVPNSACGWQLQSLIVRWRYDYSSNWHVSPSHPAHSTIEILGASSDKVYEVIATFAFNGTGLIMRDAADETKILRGSRDDAKVLLDI